LVEQDQNNFRNDSRDDNAVSDNDSSPANNVTAKKRTDLQNNWKEAKSRRPRKVQHANHWGYLSIAYLSVSLRLQV